MSSNLFSNKLALLFVGFGLFLLASCYVTKPERLKLTDQGITQLNNKLFQRYQVENNTKVDVLIRKLGLSLNQFLVYNPNIRLYIKKGQEIFVPIVDTTRTNDIGKFFGNGSSRNIAIFIPAQLESKSDLNYVKEAASNRLGLNYYAGSLFALDSLKKLGVKSRVKFFTIQKDTSKFRNSLKDPYLDSCQVILSFLKPNYNKVIRQLNNEKNYLMFFGADQGYEITDDSCNHCYYIYPDTKQLYEIGIEDLHKQYPRANFIIIANRKDKFQANLQDHINITLKSVYGRPGNLFDLDKIPDISPLSALFSTEENNIIINLESNVKNVSRMLDRLIALRDKLSFFMIWDENALPPGMQEKAKLAKLEVVVWYKAKLPADYKNFKGILKYQNVYKQGPGLASLIAIDAVNYIGSLYLGGGLKAFKTNRLPNSKGIVTNFEWNRPVNKAGLSNKTFIMEMFNDKSKK